jgi:hypothetical protein
MFCLVGLVCNGGHAPLKRAASGQATSEQNQERKTNRRVATVLQRLLGTKRESLIFKGFKKHRTQHEIFGKERRRTARNPLFAGLSVGALGEIRTPDPRIRSPMLYPAELRARKSFQWVSSASEFFGSFLALIAAPAF